MRDYFGSPFGVPSTGFSDPPDLGITVSFKFVLGILADGWRFVVWLSPIDKSSSRQPCNLQPGFPPSSFAALRGN
jgi:hypothetical protein